MLQFKNMKRFSTLVFAVALIFSLLLTSIVMADGEKKEERDPDRELRVAFVNDIKDLNPHLYSGDMATQAIVFDPLVYYTADGLKPALAESWDISEDGKTYTFHLRKGVTFTDGEPWNAESCKANFDAVLRNRQRHNWLYLSQILESCEIVDEYTVELKLSTAYYPTLIELSLPRPFRFISPKCFVDGETMNGVNGVIGTGPWVLSEYEPGQEAVLTANENYWGEKPGLKKIVRKVLPDKNAILLALQNGEIDLIYNAIESVNFKEMQENDAYSCYIGEPDGTRLLVLNSKIPAFQDVRVRQALTAAIDREAISKGVLDGLEPVATGLFAKNVPYCDIELPEIKFDPEEAARLLDEAGWVQKEEGAVREKDGEKLKLSVQYSMSNSQFAGICEYVESNLRDIGVELEIIALEGNVANDKQKAGDFVINCASRRGKPYAPQSEVSNYTSDAQAQFRSIEFLPEKDKIQALVKEALESTDEKVRQEKYTELLTLIAETYSCIPLTYSTKLVVAVPELQGINLAGSEIEINYNEMYFVK